MNWILFLFIYIFFCSCVQELEHLKSSFNLILVFIMKNSINFIISHSKYKYIYIFQNRFHLQIILYKWFVTKRISNLTKLFCIDFIFYFFHQFYFLDIKILPHKILKQWFSNYDSKVKTVIL